MSTASKGRKTPASGAKEGTLDALAEGRVDRVNRRVRKSGEPVDVRMMLVPLSVDGEHSGF